MIGGMKDQFPKPSVDTAEERQKEPDGMLNLTQDEILRHFKLLDPPDVEKFVTTENRSLYF